MTFDLDLFLRLNEEYRSRPVVPAPRSTELTSLLETSRRRARDLDERHGLRGRRVLEVGCGRGQFCRVLADEYDCDVVGVDISRSASWTDRPDLRFEVHDIAMDDNALLGEFDVIVSFAVWEHVEHPYAALAATRDLLRDDGWMYLFANLHRGRQASHRYRDVTFPWPHLLFGDDVFEQFYRHIGREPRRAAWVNKLTWAQYLVYFDRLDFNVEELWPSKLWFDEDFYRRFEDELGRYPRFDLERDFINAIVTPRRPAAASAEAASTAELDAARRERDAFRERLQQIEASRSWRLTRPLRAVNAARHRRSLGR